jgi:hypothetical protein
MADDNVMSLGAARATAAGDNRLWSPVECLEEAVRDVKSGRITADKVVVIFLNTGTEDDPDFNVDYYVAKTKASQILAALECVKSKILAEMGYP